jgi:methylated-DNA-[protein]-cysteine S-methyltransferase
MTTQFCLFDTALGPCALSWGEYGIRGVQLPERNEAAIRGRIARRYTGAREDAPTGDIADARDAIVALIGGENRDLREIALDMREQPGLNVRVYEIARTIVPGATLTYGAIALALGDRTLAQAVGQALGKNPYPIVVPCHRVLAAGGKIGGFSAPTGIALKRKLLAIESVHARGAPSLFDPLLQAS